VEGPKLLVGDGAVAAATTEDDEAGGEPVDDGERGLAAVVRERELGRGGGVAPGPANGAAAANVLGPQTDKDLVDDDL
jgi:hypothetical protein